MVEIEVTKAHNSRTQADKLMAQIKRLKIKGYKTDCGCGYDCKDINWIRVRLESSTLKSFTKTLAFNFFRNGLMYDLTVKKMTKESLLLSKAVERITGCKVKIKLSNTTQPSCSKALYTPKELKGKERLAKGDPEDYGKALLVAFLCFMIIGLVSGSIIFLGALESDRSELEALPGGLVQGWLVSIVVGGFTFGIMGAAAGFLACCGKPVGY